MSHGDLPYLGAFGRTYGIHGLRLRTHPHAVLGMYEFYISASELSTSSAIRMVRGAEIVIERRRMPGPTFLFGVVRRFSPNSTRPAGVTDTAVLASYLLRPCQVEHHFASASSFSRNKLCDLMGLYHLAIGLVKMSRL